MSIACCEICAAFIDTDEQPEAYREEFGEQCLCDSCYDAKMERLENEQDEGDRNAQ